MDEKHICFFCNREIDEANFVSSVYNYGVCSECNAKMNEGVTLIAVASEPSYDDQNPMVYLDAKNTELKESSYLYPNGEWIVLPAELVIELFGHECADGMIKQKYNIISVESMSKIKDVFEKIKLRQEGNEDTE